MRLAIASNREHRSYALLLAATLLETSTERHVMLPNTCNTGADRRFNDIPPGDKPPLVSLSSEFNFVLVRQHTSVVWLAGMVPFLPKKDQPRGPAPIEEKIMRGKIGDGGLPPTGPGNSGYRAAELVGLNLLVTLQDAITSLDRVAAVLQVIGAVNSLPGFTAQSAVLNGCTDVMVKVFGAEVGRPTRMAYGVSELPFNAAIEALMVVAIREESPHGPLDISP